MCKVVFICQTIFSWKSSFSSIYCPLDFVSVISCIGFFIRLAQYNIDVVAFPLFLTFATNVLNDSWQWFWFLKNYNQMYIDHMCRHTNDVWYAENCQVLDRIRSSNIFDWRDQIIGQYNIVDLKLIIIAKLIRSYRFKRMINLILYSNKIRVTQVL